MLLFSRLDADSSLTESSLYMLVLGFGLGMTMQDPSASLGASHLDT